LPAGGECNGLLHCPSGGVIVDCVIDVLQCVSVPWSAEIIFPPDDGRMVQGSDSRLWGIARNTGDDSRVIVDCVIDPYNA
jgi:hypothetical protein